ncbi:hypothetical protein C8R46DRAFT_1242915 [Mycena filopes]|nr:hypothetical protein C8R46DRAFT_1242915 [Mycena filopes]
MFSLPSVLVALAVASSTCAELSVSQSANITWIDDGAAPTLAAFGLAKASIYAGNSAAQTSLQTISESIDVTNPLFLSFIPDASIGPNSAQYFIRFESLALKDPSNPAIPALAFSHQFSLSGMTGVFNAAVQSQIDGQSTAPIGGVAAATSSTAAPASTTKSTASKSAAPSGSAANSAKGAAASGASAAVPAFVTGQKLWLGIATGVFGAVMGAAVL